MRILLTGGTGRVGQAAVKRLAAGGHDVRVIGRRPDAEIEGAAYASCDITDFDALQEQMRDRDAVVHLAAIPSPSRPGPQMFRVNCQGTFNVFEAAAQAGIRRMVQASSINSFGLNWGIKECPVLRLPLDEEHPTFTTDPYSFSKNVVEDIGRYFWRRCGLSSVALRIPAVYHGGTGEEQRWRDRGIACKAAFERLMQRPDDAVVDYARGLVERFNLYRSRPEYARHGSKSCRDDHGDAGPDLWRLVIHRADFWTMIDDRDCAQAIEKGLAADYEGSHPLYVNDSHNGNGIPSAELARLFFPDAAVSEGSLDDTVSVVSIEKARALIGYAPEYSLFGPRPAAARPATATTNTERH